MTQHIGTEETHKVIMEYVHPVNTYVPELKTPVMRLKYEQSENPINSFKARSEGIKVTCLSLALHILSVYVLCVC